MGTSIAMLAGSAMARNTGTRRYAGAVLRRMKCLSKSRTQMQMPKNAESVKTADPVEAMMIREVCRWPFICVLR